MDPLAVAVGTALVGAMATDSWRQAKRALVALWRRVRPEAEADTVGAEFGQARMRLLAALEGAAAPGAAPGIDSGVTSGVTSGVVSALETDWQFPRRATAGARLGDCPYPGLSAFGPEQSPWFFGRDTATADLLLRLDERLRTGGPVAVVAPSGAGKSSLL
ncbi:nSTAND1 domain-containing NTPase [Streptomyces sp. NPDC000878]